MSRNRKIIYTLLLLVFGLLITGCSKKNTNETQIGTMERESENPFELTDEDTVIMGAMGHRIANPKMDENGENLLPLNYSGGELEIDYIVNASGKAKNVGFLVFIDGVPQPYKYNTTESAYEYMHIFDLEEDDKDTPFTFIFTPVTGKKGDTLEISITSVYNPAFIPDMKETSSYGGYHTTLLATYSLHFEKDAEVLDDSSIPEKNYLKNVSQSTEAITEEMLERHSGMQEIDLETLETVVLSEVHFDGKNDVWKDGNLQVDDNGILNVTFKLFGHPGVKYKNTFYSNHQALATKNGETSFETVLEKGKVAVINAEIDLEEIEDFNTFYVISTPVNAGDFPEDVILLEKTDSTLLYK